MTREDDGHRQVVRPKGGIGGASDIRKGIPSGLGNIRRERLALGGEVSGCIKICRC